MKEHIVRGIRRALTLGSLATASVGAHAAEITVFNKGLQTLLDTVWGRAGVLLATLVIVGFGIKLLSGTLDIGWAFKIVLGIMVIWGAVELFSAFGV